MKLNITIEVEVEDLPSSPGAPSATADDFINLLRIHTSAVTRNFEGKIVKFAAEKA